MMAFFLLLWLLSATTEEQKEGIAEYFSPVTAFNPESVSQNPSGSDGVLGGRTITAEGAMMNDTSPIGRSEEHTSELQSLMRISYAVFCLKKKKKTKNDRILRHRHIKYTYSKSTEDAHNNLN